jgi:sigma-B regulation protein RsbU (phosphoserine phosphatase)
MHRPLRILLVEDNPGDARLLVEGLKEPDVPHVLLHCERLSDAVQHLHGDRKGSIDVVILDLSLPDAQGLDGVQQIRRVAPRMPIVVHTSLEDDAVAFRAVEQGAQDYLVKGKAEGSVLVRALRYAIERKRADEAARREDEAARAAALRETVMGILGNDLRVPLRTITASVEVLLRGDGLTPTQLGAAKRIATSSERMEGMIGDLFDFAQARLGDGYQLARSPCDLEEVCRQVIQRMAASHPEQAIQLTTRGSCKGHWDRDRITKVVSEMLANAARHGSAGSRIKVSVRDAGADVALAVQNDGVPALDHAEGQLFEPFYRGASRGDEAARGLGLGLYIAKQIVVAHRGTIDVRSGPADGTTFTITLPRA